MLTSVIGWIISGFVIGLIARALHPGRDDMGWISTMMLGIGGSLVGGTVAWATHVGIRPYQPGGWVMSIIGAIILLVMGFFSARPRTIS